jgi:hypothetical protein
MNKYRVHTVQDEFRVFEVETGQVIKTYNNHRDAARMVRAHNRGGGFKGFTPAFIIKNYAIRSDCANNGA